MPARVQPWQQRVIALEDHGPIDAGREDLHAVDADDAFTRELETGNQIENGRLAATAGPDQDEELALRDLKEKIAQDRGTIFVAGIVEIDVTESNERPLRRGGFQR